MPSNKQRPPNILNFQEKSYTVWQTKTSQHTQILGVRLFCLTSKDHLIYSSPRNKVKPSDKQRPLNILKSQEQRYTIWQTKTTQHIQVPGVELHCLTNKDHPTYSSPRCNAIRSDKQRPPNMLKFQVVRRYSCTPRTWVCWVVFVCQTM
jgi:hypothetical protein